MATDESHKPPPRTRPMTDEESLGSQQHLPFVQRIAREVHRRSPEFEIGDLIGYGWKGLAASLQSFDAAQGVPFENFAYHRVKGAMQDGIREFNGHNKFRRGLHAAQKQIEAYRQRRQELSETYERLLAFVDKHPTPRRASEREADNLPDRDRSPETRAHLLRIVEQINEAATSLETKERELLVGMYGEGKTLEEAGVKVGLSKSWASRRHARAIKAIAAKLTTDRSK
jgi:RNA polymerase sigma factor for flagellar operon FliA